jgi:hypothetical protein
MEDLGHGLELSSHEEVLAGSLCFCQGSLVGLNETIARTLKWFSQNGYIKKK